MVGVFDKCGSDQMDEWRTDDLRRCDRSGHELACATCIIRRELFRNSLDLLSAAPVDRL